jgi:Protein of unknown function (DUF2637)
VLLPQLRRIRWAVRAALILGVAASVAANVLHAQPNIISQVISAWPPMALLLTVELTSRIPMHRPSLAALRVFATIAIAGIAAWVSYWHMQGVAMKFGETETSSYLLPLSVDGLIVVASVSLVELAGRIRVFEERLERERTAPPVPPVQFVEPAPVPVQVQAPQMATSEFHVPDDVELMSDAPVSPGVGPLTHSAPLSPVVAATAKRAPVHANGSTPPERTSVRPAVSAPSRTVVTAPTTKPTDANAPKPRRPVLETAELAAAIQAMHPEMSEAELAKQLNISTARLRQIRREARETKVGGARR